MRDPYLVLGVQRNATNEDIKKAYRDLARKYHPDNYHDNPLSDLAQEKMKEINEAYDEITKSRASGGNGSSGSYDASYSSSQGAYSQNAYSSSGSSDVYSKIRAAIDRNDLSTAESMLNSITARGAEWNFLMGSLCYRKGWMDDAYRFYADAVSMDPNNQEYTRALSYMKKGGSAYGYERGGVSTDQACDCCGKLMIADCCCECMGGDLIPCC